MPIDINVRPIVTMSRSLKQQLISFIKARHHDAKVPDITDSDADVVNFQCTTSDQQRTPLLSTLIQCGRITLAMNLIATDDTVDVNAVGTAGFPPLYYAIRAEEKDLMVLLVRKGADTRVVPYHDNTNYGDPWNTWIVPDEMSIRTVIIMGPNSLDRFEAIPSDVTEFMRGLIGVSGENG